MRPDDGLAACVQSRREPVVMIGPVHVVLNVLLAAPNDLHRPFHLLRDLDHEHGAVDIEPAPLESKTRTLIIFAAGAMPSYVPKDT